MKLTIKQRQLVKEYAKSLQSKKLNEARNVDPKGMALFMKAAGINLSKIDKTKTTWTDIGANIDIPISSLPPLFQPVFASITLNKIMIGFDPDYNGWWLSITYSWKHYTGSNGLNLRLFSRDDGKTWEA